MPEPQHVLDRRATMLGSRIQSQIASLARAFRPKGSTPAFSEALPRQKALAWWSRNIDQPEGQRQLAKYDPITQMDLRRQLASYQPDEPGYEEE